MGSADRHGFIYFTQAWEPVWEKWGLIKIGFATDPERRINSLATLNPTHLYTHFVIPGTLYQEKQLHVRFADYRAHGEWFIPWPDLISGIKKFRPVGYKKEPWMGGSKYMDRDFELGLTACSLTPLIAPRKAAVCGR